MVFYVAQFFREKNYFHVELHREFLKKCFSISAARRKGASQVARRGGVTCVRTEGTTVRGALPGDQTEMIEHS